VPNINKIKRTIKRNRLKILLLAIAVSTITFFSLNEISPNQIATEQNKTPSPNPNQITTITEPDSNIQNLLQTEIQQLTGTYNIVIKDLKTNQIYSIGQNQKIPSASIYKLAVMYKAFDALEKGELKKNQILSNGLTVEKALEQMITISDNESALILAEKLGWKNINYFLQSEGVTGFNLMIKDYPETTARATADLLERIYRKTAVSAQASREMLELLLAQQKNDRIPSLLPPNIKVAHKTGELDNFRHDAGIVFGKRSDYIFVFLTETPVPEDAYTNIANLSKTTFDALENPNTLK